jgi:hypothetical protein
VKTLDRIEDSDFVLTGEFGEVTKAQQIDDLGDWKLVHLHYSKLNK